MKANDQRAIDIVFICFIQENDIKQFFMNVREY